MASGTVSDLSDGQIVGVVLGSVFGALALAAAAALCWCCVCAPRRRQTGDLTWAKHSDVEAAARAAVPHVPVPDAPAGSWAGNGTAAAAASSPGRPVLPVAVAATAGEGVSAVGFSGGSSGVPPLPLAAAGLGAAYDDLAAMQREREEGYDSFGGAGSGGLPSPTGATVKPTPRSGGEEGGSGRGGVMSGVAAFMLKSRAFSAPRRSGSSGSTRKDKNLEVSRSARVEPSAEVEMAAPFEPAATNHGPPLSKSSMLMRWLHGAEDDHLGEVVAAQLAASAAAGAAGKPSAAAGGSPLGGKPSAAGINPFSDRLPLLSLAAQQSGIVWSKMPPSVASSPAVSVTEGSQARHMLLGTAGKGGTYRRPSHNGDVLSAAGDAAAASDYMQLHATGSFAAGPTSPPSQLLFGYPHPDDGGDNRYPASLARAAVESFTVNGRAGGGGAPGAGGGVVFDRLLPLGAASHSRVASLGGGTVLPLPPAVSAAAAATAETVPMVAAVAASAAAAPPSRPQAQPLSLSPSGGFTGEDAFWGLVPGAGAVAAAQAPQPAPASVPGPIAAIPTTMTPAPWLHQVAPQQLTTLREAAEEEDGAAAEEAAPPPPLAQRTSPSLQPDNALPDAMMTAAMAAVAAAPPARLWDGMGVSDGGALPPVAAGASSPPPFAPIHPSAAAAAGPASLVATSPVSPVWTQFGEVDSLSTLLVSANASVAGTAADSRAHSAGLSPLPYQPSPMVPDFGGGGGALCSSLPTHHTFGTRPPHASTPANAQLDDPLRLVHSPDMRRGGSASSAVALYTGATTSPSLGLGWHVPPVGAPQPRNGPRPPGREYSDTTTTPTASTNGAATGFAGSATGDDAGFAGAGNEGGPKWPASESGGATAPPSTPTVGRAAAGLPSPPSPLPSQQQQQ